MKPSTTRITDLVYMVQQVSKARIPAALGQLQQGNVSAAFGTVAASNYNVLEAGFNEMMFEAITGRKPKLTLGDFTLRP